MDDAVSDLKSLRITRGQCKRALTNLEKTLEADIDISHTALKVRKQALQNIFTNFQNTQHKILCFDESDDDSNEVELKYYNLLTKLEELMKGSEQSIAAVQPLSDSSSSYLKLPRIEIAAFDGTLENYKSFQDLFDSLIHNDKKISNVQKLYYLKQYLKGEPLEIINNLPLTNESYTSAIQLLKKRYDNPSLLITKHINAILDLPILHRGTADQLRTLAVKIRQQIMALENLKLPVDQWESILFCIVSRKLDTLTLRLYHSEISSEELPRVTALLDFIDKRASSIEASPSSIPAKSKAVVHVASEAKKSFNCIMCSKDHKLYKCPNFILMSPQKRHDFILGKKLCKLCLAFHEKPCRYNFKCTICSKDHNALIHLDKKDSTPNQVLHVTKSSEHNVLLPTVKVLILDAYNNKHIVRALLDSGSQTSFCTTSLASKLGISTFDLFKNIVTLGNSNIKNVKKGINLQLHSITESYDIDVTCSIVDKITVNLPQKKLDTSNFIIPNFVQLADDEYNISGEISLLLAADVFFRVLRDGKVEGGPNEPILINTHFGHVVSGNVQLSNNVSVSMHLQDMPDQDFYVKKLWETESVPEVFVESLPENDYSEMIFKESVNLKDKRFEVRMPRKCNLDNYDLSNSFLIALQRFYNLEKRFDKDPLYHTLYKDFINEYLSLGHAKVIDMDNCSKENRPLYFLPHHGVLRPERLTTKLRVVFDGSAKSTKCPSLNNILCNGPVVQKPLFDILLLFRTHKYVLMCDIRHMYRQILVHPDDRVLQNIIWRDNKDDTLKCLQLQTITYGLTSSAFLATRCLVELAYRFKDVYKLASKAILTSSYIDDVLCGSNSYESTMILKQELFKLLEQGSFEPHKWCSNDMSILHDIPKEKYGFQHKDLDQDITVKTLGLSFDIKNDLFILSSKVVSAPETPTKRSVLSAVSKFFDPMGYAGPIVVKAKLMLQKIWQHNLDWDTSLPPDLQNIWKDFHNSISEMNDICIPRDLHLHEAEEVELIGYCDASSDAYGCCLYLKVRAKENFYINLLCAKSRVVGLNSKLTIPKLELNGALLLAKLAFKVITVLDNISKIYLFSDSKISLAWINSVVEKLPPYIANRVKEINRLSKGMSWIFTPGSLNPADILSRGEDPKEIVNNDLWWHGPNYLKDNSYNFQLAEIEYPFENITSASNVTHDSTDSHDMMLIFTKISNINKLQRIIVYVFRFINKCRKYSIQTKFITVSELQFSLKAIIRYVQNYYFTKEMHCIKKGIDYKTINSSYLKMLHPFLDADNVLRVGGRLQNSDVPFTKKFPIILPKKCHITRLIILNEHLISLHGGLKFISSSLSQRYYILNAIREIKSVLHRCVVCIRFKAESAKQLMGSLPKERVSPMRAFEKVGIDYCGPFEIRLSTIRRSITSKAYVAVYVCFFSKAVHLEVVSDMTSDAFLASLKRFVSRRGLPSDIYCDNAQTFKGAHKKIDELYRMLNDKKFQLSITEYASSKGMQFHYIPAYSPHQGGLWEAAVKSFKFHYKRVIGSKLFTFEQLITLSTEIEAILNSRPICPLSEDPSDFSFLTPGHFLIGCPLISFPQPILTQIPNNRLSFWKSVEQHKQHFWRAWSKDYLVLLNKRSKWQMHNANLKIDDLVLLKDDMVRPQFWPMGRITRVFTGNDSRVRVVEIITVDKKLHTRAVTKVVVLPCKL